MVNPPIEPPSAVTVPAIVTLPLLSIEKFDELIANTPLSSPPVVDNLTNVSLTPALKNIPSFAPPASDITQALPVKFTPVPRS